MKVKMSLIWSSPSNSNMSSNKQTNCEKIRELSLMDYYNQPTVKKFVNYQPTVKKLEKFRKKGLSTIIPHVILK